MCGISLNLRMTAFWTASMLAIGFVRLRESNHSWPPFAILRILAPPDNLRFLAADSCCQVPSPADSAAIRRAFSLGLSRQMIFQRYAG